MSGVCKNCNEKLKAGAKFCGHCGASVEEARPSRGVTDSAPRPFLVNPFKLLLLSTLTFAVYDIYWFAKQWRYIKKRDEQKIRPFWRAIFSVLFVVPLLKQLRDSKAVLRGTLYIVLSLAGRLPDNWWLISLFSVVPLYQVQQDLNAQYPDVDLGGYSKKEILVAVLGGLFWALVLWSVTQV